tara:strand:- start:221 stop:460 length:240 start_codon:yes stop_codon:yes gene_type:complete
MTIEQIDLEKAKELNLHGINAVEPDHKAIFVMHTGNRYQATPWFYQADDGFYCSCEIAGISEDSESEKDIINFILKSLA